MKSLDQQQEDPNAGSAEACWCHLEIFDQREKWYYKWDRHRNPSKCADDDLDMKEPRRLTGLVVLWKRPL